MRTRVLFLLSLYFVLTLSLTGIIGIPQKSLADTAGGDLPIMDSIPDTTDGFTSFSLPSKSNIEIDYWLMLKTIFTIGI